MAYSQITLTDADRRILDSWCQALPGLGEYLGSSYEIILHSLADLEHSAIAVIHGEHSGRKVGAPITDLALQMLTNINQNGDLRPMIYPNRSRDGSLLKSTTIPVTGSKGRIIGLLCINLYLSTSMEEMMMDLLPPGQFPTTVTSSENFSNDAEDMVRSNIESIKEEVYADETISSGNKNKVIIHRLNQRGIFQIKDAVNQAASILGLSRNTVYMHIRNDK